MKKSIFFGLGALCIVICATASYFAYPIKEDDSNLEEYMNRFCMRGHQEEFSTPIMLYDSSTLAKNKYVLVELNEQVGVATLKQGISGGYKVDKLSYGNGNFIEFVTNSKDKKYVLFGGRNTSLQIAKVTFTLEGQQYSLDIPEKQRFFVSLEVDAGINEVHLDIDTLRFYNKYGEDITEQVDWNGIT